jgi:hypothetical protein
MRLALFSAQKRVTMSGESAAGTRMANMPSPAGTFNDVRRNVRADETVDKEGREHERRDKTTPAEGGDIGDKDLREELEAGVSTGNSRI